MTHFGASVDPQRTPAEPNDRTGWCSKAQRGVRRPPQPRRCRAQRAAAGAFGIAPNHQAIHVAQRCDVHVDQHIGWPGSRIWQFAHRKCGGSIEAAADHCANGYFRSFACRSRTAPCCVAPDTWPGCRRACGWSAVARQFAEVSGMRESDGHAGKLQRCQGRRHGRNRSDCGAKRPVVDSAGAIKYKPEWIQVSLNLCCTRRDHAPEEGHRSRGCGGRHSQR